MARPVYYDTCRINKVPTGRKGDGKPFIQIDKEVVFKAAQDLKSGYVFKLWMYFACNADAWDLKYTKQSIMDNFNMARTTVYDCLKVLEEKGYLVERQDGIYEFFEDPTDERKKKIGNTIVYPKFD